MNTSKDFQIGDRVIYKFIGEDSSSMASLNGLEGTVVDFNGSHVGVEFDLNIKMAFGFGHNCEGNGKDGHCRYLYPPELEIMDIRPGRIRWYKKGKLSENMSKIEKSFEAFKFQKVESARTNQLWIHLLYEGGDADTKHPVDYKLPFLFSEWEEHLDEINEIISKYKRLKKVLDCGSYGGRIRAERVNGQYRYVITRYGRPNVEIEDDLQELIDDVPNDPQNDYQDKCYLSYITLIGYDLEGAKHEAYV